MGLISQFFKPSSDPAKDLKDTLKIKESQQNFNSIAYDTIEMTKSVAQTLKDKISDYANQIESMSHMMSDALLIADKDGIITSTNDAASELFEFDTNSAIGSSVISLFKLQGCFTFEDFIQASINTTKDIYEDFEVTTSSGKIVYTDVSVACVTKTDGTVYYIIVIRDVTERITDMRKLHESEQRFRSFGEASMEALVIHDGFNILDCNEQFVTLTGFSREEILGKSPDEFVFPTDRDEVMSLERSNNPCKIEFYLITNHESPIVVSMNSRIIQWNNKTARINVIHDITIYKDEEEILKSSRERYKNILDNNIDILCCYGSDLKIDFINHTFSEYFGVGMTETVGSSVLEFIPEIDHDSFIENIKNITEENPVHRSLYRLVMPDDSVRWQDWIDRGIFDSNGNLLEYQSVSRDVTHYINVKISSK